MSKRKQTVKLISAMGLFIALMLPTVIQFAHVFGVHEHFVCTDQDSHVHQTPVKCDICTVQVVPFDSAHLEYSDLLPPAYLDLQAESLSALKFDTIIFNSNPLRGPPTYS